MPTWRCPHCGTPQAETARCWVCRRSSTACATCRHFRRSVAAGMGFCGLDPRRTPLDGGEIRACWEARPVVTAPDSAPPFPLALPVAVGRPSASTIEPRDFVEVVSPAADGDAAAAIAATDDELAIEPASAEPRVWPVAPDAGWSFWAELEG